MPSVPRPSHRSRSRGLGRAPGLLLAQALLVTACGSAVRPPAGSAIAAAQGTRHVRARRR
jgi:hypothetical protein